MYRISSGQVSSGIILSSWETMLVYSGGKVTGALTIAEGGEVSLAVESVVDFDISTVAPGGAALINDWSLVDDAGAYCTITTSETQAVGTYALAGGAAGFDKSITVVTDTDAELGVITVGGELTTEKYIYALGVTDGTLALTVKLADTEPPVKPVAAADITTATNKNVTVTATFSDDSAVREYSLDGETWQSYTTGVIMKENGTVYFCGADAAGNVSDVTAYEVTNIDKVAPDAPAVTANITTKTTEKVTVTATFSSDSAQKQYSTDNKTWSDYTTGVVFTENGTVYFRGTDAAGNVSPVTSYAVSNIIVDTFTTENTVAPGAEAAFTPKLEAAGWYTVKGTFKGSKGSVTVVDKTGKKVASGTVKNGVITFKKELLLDNSNTYKVVVKNTDKKGGEATYSVKLTAKELFTKGDKSDNTLQGAKTLAARTTANDWVGYGDAVDYYKLGVDAQGGIYDLNLSGVRNNVKLTVYSKSGAKVKTVTASAAKPNLPLANLCLDNGSYAVIEAPKAAKAQNSDYALKLTEKATFNRKNNDWNGATVLTTADAPFTGALTKAAGGDVVDYCDVSALGNLSFKTTAGKVKVSFYDTNKQAVKVAVKTGGKDKTAAAVSLTSGKVDNFTIGTLPSSVKYLKIEATGKTLNSYTIGKIA